MGKITPSNKHIELRNHIIKHLISEGHIRVEWIHTKSNLADIGTKVMKDVQAYELLRNVLVHPRPGKDSVLQVATESGGVSDGTRAQRKNPNYRSKNMRQL